MICLSVLALAITIVELPCLVVGRFDKIFCSTLDKDPLLLFFSTMASSEPGWVLRGGEDVKLLLWWVGAVVM